MPHAGGSTSHRRALVTLIVVLGALAGCARPAANTSTNPAATATPAAQGASPAAGSALERSRAAQLAVPAKNGVATSAPSPAGTSTAASVATPAVSPSANGPQILSIATSPSVVHAGQSVSWDVRTTSDVATVTAHVSAYTIPIVRTGPGHFTLNFAIPNNVPSIFHGIYNLNVTAATSGGATASRIVTLTFQ